MFIISAQAARSKGAEEIKVKIKDKKTFSQRN